MELRTATSVRSSRKRVHYFIDAFANNGVMTSARPAGWQQEVLTDGRSTMNAERFERNREARHALALSVAGVMTVMVVWNLMLFFY